MFPHPDMDAVLFELNERRRQADLRRLVRESRQSQPRSARRLRWALGSTLLRLGVAVLGDDAWLHSDIASWG